MSVKVGAIKNKIFELLKFSLPIIVGQLGQMLITAGDIWVAGKHSTLAVAAIGVAGGIIGPIMMVGMGVLMGLTPILSKKRGEGDDIGKYFVNSLFFSLLTSIPWVFVCLYCSKNLSMFNFNPEIIPDLKNYLRIVSFSLIGSAVFMGLKEFLQSFEKTYFANGLSIACIFLNLFLNYSFVFGKFGFQEYGVVGLAYSSVIIRSVMGLVLCLYCLRFSKLNFGINRAFIFNVIKLGSPVSLTFLLEVSAFSMVSLLIGKMSTNIAAAHNIILTLSSVTFMIPLAISSAVSVKVGHSFGEKNFRKISDYCFSSLAISLGFMSFTATCFIFFPATIISFFSTDIEVMEAAASMLSLVAIFQIFDGLQITLGGVLRGINVTKPIFVATIVGYWIFGMPIGLYLAYQKNLHQIGLWSGLTTSLFCVAVFLSFYTSYKLKSIKFQ